MKYQAAVITVSDKGSVGERVDTSGPAVRAMLEGAGYEVVYTSIVPDDKLKIGQELTHCTDALGCDLVLTTGGTGPARRDVTPDATLAIADREMPGFGEQMRQVSLHFVPTAILSRQVGVIRKQALILNLPGQPKSIKETLEGLKAEEGSVIVHGIFASVPYCIQLLDGPYVETDEKVVAAFRPKNARRETIS